MKRFIVTIILALVVAISFYGCGGKEQKEVTTQATTQEATTEETTQEATTEEATTMESTTQESTAENIKLCFYYKVGNTFKTEEFTAATSIDEAENVSPKNIKVNDVEYCDLGDYYIKPEIRLYGVDPDSRVAVVYESEATKATNVDAYFNDGVSQFFYWNVEMYDKNHQGVYSFKVTITNEREGFDGEIIEESRDLFYKVVVNK